ncbi:NAD(P)/FAD-dependent oxidoreductase [Reichenbachiella agariperforans]|uniref:NAD(P)/FAD-dependent oxidoreductase n=1 Tax=Reichenbachiella agariperforans TaxID=156994 RepID=UPI001C09E413|nr:FAD-dependent oxidoreductase [Reichenbachiella agariperforans]MBU2915538.1 FAD-binding oxidoreductase [Reichenbachiella agariperforans]
MKDYLIIGHGLAGAVLAHSLTEKNHSVMVIDQPNENHSSTVAAGLYNPITGRQMVKTWLADEIFSMLEPFYRKLEQHLDAIFLQAIGIYRPFVNQEEQNDWDIKQSDEKFSPFISFIRKKHHPEYQLDDPFGGIQLKPAGFLQIPKLLQSSKEKLLHQASYLEEEYDETRLVVASNHVEYNGETYRKLIYANGTRALNTNLFGWVPLRPVKGEILRGKLDKPLKTILNRGVFILPTDTGLVRIGSNYQHHFEDILPSDKGQEEITRKLESLLHEPIEIVDSVAGVRPATKDRRPIIGKHPEYEHIYLFNGFGSKGVSLIPFFTDKFLTYLSDETPLMEEVNITRYYKAYPSK